MEKYIVKHNEKLECHFCQNTKTEGDPVWLGKLLPGQDKQKVVCQACVTKLKGLIRESQG